jgi:hypothetical protein
MAPDPVESALIFMSWRMRSSIEEVVAPSACEANEQIICLRADSLSGVKPVRVSCHDCPLVPVTESFMLNSAVFSTRGL